MLAVSVPSRGFFILYINDGEVVGFQYGFPSPLGVSLFSIFSDDVYDIVEFGFRPLSGFLYSLFLQL